MDARRTGGRAVTARTVSARALALALAWLAPAAPSAASDGLPEGVEWQELPVQRLGDSYQRQWVPAGTREEDAPWLVVEQRLRLAEPKTESQALALIHMLARDACTAVRSDGPEPVAPAAGGGVVGRIYCAHQRGRPHGTVTDQRVVADGDAMLVVTSELRTSPTAVPGVFPFDSTEDSEEFGARMLRSWDFVRGPVRVAPGPSTDAGGQGLRP